MSTLANHNLRRLVKSRFLIVRVVYAFCRLKMSRSIAISDPEIERLLSIAGSRGL